MDTQRSSTTIALVLVMGLVTGCAATSPGTAIHGAEPYPNDSAADWVTYADHVVVATVTSEREMPRGDHEEDTGEGSVGRSLTLQADEVVWSADDPAHGPPEGEFSMPGMGWTLTDGDRSPMVAEDTPRLEVGHSYVFALFWMPEVPDEPEPYPARWNALGLDAVVPFDDGIIGNGEEMGELVSPAQERRGPTHADDATLEQTLAGEGLDALKSLLATTPPDVRGSY
ncbi:MULTISPECIES: hypothetical protein [Isoptericola]|uniref:hypothetical protein n=1 Tax=Isoptericola TaxID=254250 RepID=UPI000F6495B2|nr:MULTISPECIES: hypothetical protein [Isoptericola]